MTREWTSPDGRIRLINGDCIEGMKLLPDCSVDSIVTDPPYGLSFMGKKWDYDVPSEAIWRECLRVLKPGGHLLAFAGTRTQHRMAVRIEDAGFEIRDMISFLYSTNETMRQLVATMTPEQLKLMDATFGRDGMMGWGFGSGFPKSANVSKHIDKLAGAEREVVGEAEHWGRKNRSSRSAPDADMHFNYTGEKTKIDGCAIPITAPATEAAKQWNGWGTALKPALEPITVARKPFKGTVAANVLEHGTGAINVDGCRVSLGDEKPFSYPNGPGGCKGGEFHYQGRATTPAHGNAAGRWPANLITDGSEEVVGLFPSPHGAGKARTKDVTSKYEATSYGAPETRQMNRFGDSGSAARFFYCAKASKADRDEGCENIEAKVRDSEYRQPTGDPLVDRLHGCGIPRANNHPTVKPTDLMRYLCRLVTPPGGVVLDPFMGSGSTGKAAMLEEFRFIGCEIDPQYIEIARARIEYAINHPHECEDERQLDLFATLTPPQPQHTAQELF